MTNWDDYRYFSNLVRAASVRGAAEVLGVNPSTVTRRLDGLEARLGLKLFVRSHSGLLMTRDGERLMARLEPVTTQLGELEEQIVARGEDVGGLIRITMPDVFAITLMAEFADFASGHPKIRLEFLPAYRNLDLVRGEADMAIRVTDQPPDALIGRSLGGYRLAVYASRQYLSAHDPLSAPEGCVWIESGLESVRAPEFKGRFFPKVPPGVRCNNVLLQHAAVRAHMGLTLLPCAVADPDEILCRVGGFEPMDAQEIWLLFRPELRGVARIQSVSSHILEVFERLQPRLLGN
ncbi:MAG: LysR family transcriptional regulator [Pseudomonadales bacterium]